MRSANDYASGAVREASGANGQGGPRSPNDGQGGPRSSNDGQGGPRSSNDGQGGPRSSNDGQGGPRSPNDGQGDQGVLQVSGGPDSFPGPIGLSDLRYQSGYGCRPQGGPEDPNRRFQVTRGGGGSLRGQGGHVPARQAAPVLWTPHAPWPEGNARPCMLRSSSQLFEFNLAVPFRSPVEAEMARRALTPDAQRYVGLIHRELVVDGCVLVVWTSRDPVLFRISINCFLDQVSLVMRNIQRMGPPYLQGFGPERSAEA